MLVTKELEEVNLAVYFKCNNPIIVCPLVIVARTLYRLNDFILLQFYMVL